jgi:cytoskeletal protein CcmA (bactofilin family)
VALFQSKHREADGVQPESDAAVPTGKAEAGAIPDRTNPQPPAQGGNEVANIGKSISIKGDLTGNEDMVIEGKVEGKVDLPNNQLTIGANGTVQAEVTAKGIVVVGRVAGDIHGIERVEIQGTGIVEGDVSAPRLIVAEGAVVNGAIKMTKQSSAAATDTSSEASPPPNTPPEVRRAG